MQVEVISPMQITFTKGGQFGFRGRMFPMLGSLIGFISIVWTYYIAINKQPPDIKPFPQDDITHTAIQFPQYRIFRIGLMACAPLFSISFQIMKNYLIITSFQQRGYSDLRIGYWGWMSTLCGLGLAVSTATISDSSDMNWTLHTIGASSFFVMAYFLILQASKIYISLWQYGPFCPLWSYRIKQYTSLAIVGLLGIQVLQWVEVYNSGALVEWLATFYLMVYFMSLYWDFKKMDIMLYRS